MDLHLREPVDDVHPRLLQSLRPVDVPLLLESGLQLDQAHGLLARLRRAMSAGTRAESSLVRYTVALRPITWGSRDACSTNASTELEKESYGTCTRASARRSEPNSARGLAAENGGA